MVSHNDGDPLTTFESVDVTGYACDSHTLILVELLHKPTDTWVIAASTFSGGLQINNETLYPFKAQLDVGALPSPRCFDNAECQAPHGLDRVHMRVRALASGVTELYTLVEDGWDCIMENLQDSYVEAGAACVDDDTPVLGLTVHECGSTSDCAPGLVCAADERRVGRRGAGRVAGAHQHRVRRSLRPARPADMPRREPVRRGIDHRQRHTLRLSRRRARPCRFR